MKYSAAVPFNPELGWQAYVPDGGPLRQDAVSPLRAQRPEAAGDLARTVAELRRRPARWRTAARSSAARSTWGSRTSTWPTTTGLRTAAPRSTSGGSSARTCGRYRDEIVISTKAGYDMWPGPYGEWGSRKYLLASLDQSLQRMRLDYVDIFYSHRFDPDTPLEETMGALDTAVRQGKARYVGISSYGPRADRGGGDDPARAGHAAADPPAVLLDAQPLDRARSCSRCSTARASAHRVLAARPGAADRPYLNGIPDDSRVRSGNYFSEELVTRGEPRARAGAQRDRAGARPVAGADGDRLGAARSARHVGADRR